MSKEGQQSVRRYARMEKTLNNKIPLLGQKHDDSSKYVTHSLFVSSGVQPKALLVSQPSRMEMPLALVV
jgi:hypothetical protein